MHRRGHLKCKDMQDISTLWTTKSVSLNPFRFPCKPENMSKHEDTFVTHEYLLN